MAKIEFTNEELEILKQAVEAYHEGGKDKAAEVLKKSGIKLEMSEGLKEMAAPGIVGSDSCYACIACLVFAAMAAINWISN
ncbi:hypothetical protein NXH76_23170 [Blautia schinkii]|nr:hypothetical protein [Blautia schinkii]